MVGTMKDMGMSTTQIIVTIMVTLTLIAVIILMIAYFAVYKYIHRNRKGQYFAHAEETNTTLGVRGNTSTNAKV